MNYSRVVGRNQLSGDYAGSFNHEDRREQSLSLIRGDMRRLESDQRDERHLAAYATRAGITVAQAKQVLDDFFGAQDVIHERAEGMQSEIASPNVDVVDLCNALEYVARALGAMTYNHRDTDVRIISEAIAVLKGSPSAAAAITDETLRAIASRHARDAVAPLGSRVNPGDPVVMQEKLRAEEVIFYAMKVAFGSRSASAVLSAQGSPVRLHGSAGLLGPLAFLTVHADPDLPDDIVELRDSLGRVLGKIINVGRG